MKSQIKNLKNIKAKDKTKEQKTRSWYVAGE
jgi:hypothetical protein